MDVVPFLDDLLGESESHSRKRCESGEFIFIVRIRTLGHLDGIAVPIVI